jgi:hypothetical protein
MPSQVAESQPQRVQHPLVTELDLVSQTLREFGDKINVGIHQPLRMCSLLRLANHTGVSLLFTTERNFK